MIDRRHAFCLAAISAAMKAKAGHLTHLGRAEFALQTLEWVRDDLELSRVAIDFLSVCKINPKAAGEGLHNAMSDLFPSADPSRTETVLNELAGSKGDTFAWQERADLK